MNPSYFERDANRREVLKRMVQIGLTLPVAAPLLAACGTASNTGAESQVPAVEITDPNDPRFERRTVLDSFYTLDNDYFQGWDRASREMCAVYNLERDRQVDNSSVDALRGIFEAAVTRQIAGVVNAPAIAASTPEVIGITQQAGIPTSTAWSNAPWSTPLDIGDYFVSYQTGNDEALARAVCEILFKEMGGKGKFIHIEGIRGNSASDRRNVGVDEALAAYPNVQMVAREEGGFSRSVTQPVIESLLTAHPDVAGIMCSNDDSAIAVVNALESRNMQVPVVGIDVINEFLDAMQRGGTALASAAPHGSWLGAYCMVKVFDAMNGFQLTVPERMMYFGGFVVDTPEAAAAYQDLMYKAERFPFDYEKWSRVLHPDDWDPQNSLRPIDPNAYWANYPKPAGYQLPPDYATATDSGEFQRIEEMYKTAFKIDPWKDIRKLCKNNGGADVL